MRNTCFYFSLMMFFMLVGGHKLNAQNKDKSVFKAKDWSVQHVSLMANYQLSSAYINMKDQGNGQFAYKGSSNNLMFNARVFTKRGLALRLGVGTDSVNYTYQNGAGSTNYDAKRKDLKSLIGAEIHFPIARPVWFYTGIYLPFTITGKDYLYDVKNGAQNVGTVTIDNDGKVHFGLGADIGFNIKLAKFVRLGVEANGTFTQFSQAYWDVTVAEDLANLKQMQGGVFATLGIAL